MNIIRTYPQPDSPAPYIGPRERALAVFKYLLDLEPEQAKDHALFALIEHAFQVEQNAGFNACYTGHHQGKPVVNDARPCGPSLCEQLTRSQSAEVRFAADGL